MGEGKSGALCDALVMVNIIRESDDIHKGKKSIAIAFVDGYNDGAGIPHTRPPGEGEGYSLQYSCLENPMDRGAWWATVHGVSKSQTRLNN